jgi:predicted amidohydrolase
VRFPEQARALKLKYDIQLMLYSALWPWQRDHVWQTLLKARAIENGMFTLGCCLSGIDNGVERLDGAGNYAYDPLGASIYPDGCLYKLDLARLDDVLVDTRALYSDVTRVELVEGQ